MLTIAVSAGQGGNEKLREKTGARKRRQEDAKGDRKSGPGATAGCKGRGQRSE